MTEKENYPPLRYISEEDFNPVEITSKPTDKEIIKAFEDTINTLKNRDCLIAPKEGVENLRVGLESVLDLINCQQEELESIRLSLGLINKRKYYRKFVDEVFRKEKGKELSTPDFDYIYELYFKQQAEIERLEVRLRKERHQFADLGKMYSEIRAEAIKEFVEKFEAYIPNIEGETTMECVKNAIKQTLKEMVGK
jgi:hypothetical protein